MQTFGSAPDETEVGYFCFWERGAVGAPAACSSARPYVNTLSNERTIDGADATVCGLEVTTCPALNDFRNPDTNCAPDDEPDDSLCGEPGFTDGYCRVFEDLPEPSSDVYRCTVPCGSEDDCKKDFDCLPGTPDVCEL
jgi:hypothetical protein